MIGFLPVDKPAGPTSHDIVALARRGLGERRIGHTGTLDPFATGLLLLCVGAATRLAEYLAGLDKSYEATARLGIVTDTLDGTGEVVRTNEAWTGLGEAEIRAAFESQVGPLRQLPPAYSAKKIAGRRAYALARAGEDVAPAPVEVEVFGLSVVAVDPPYVRFNLRCSSGTYVRALARDAGETLGVGAHLTQLRRTAVGGFTSDRALPVDRLGDPTAVASALVSPLEGLSHLPAIHLDAGDADDIRHGRAIGAPDGAPRGMVVLAMDGAVVAMAESDGTRVRPRKVLA
jgi:tRNA pseudouridine55 synthase